MEATLATNGMLYGIIGALGVAVMGGGAYIAKVNGAFDSAPPTTMATPAPATPAPKPAPVTASAATPKPPAPPVATAPPPGPTAAQAEQVRTLVLDARRAITRGNFDNAERALDQAERIDPRSADVIAARRDLREQQQQARRDDRRGDRRVDGLVAQARAAIASHDYMAADRLLDQAEGIDSHDRGVQQARAELDASTHRDRGPGRR